MNDIQKLDYVAIDKLPLEELEKVDLDGHLASLAKYRDTLNATHDFETTDSIGVLMVFIAVESSYKQTIYLVNKRDRLRRDREN